MKIFTLRILALALFITSIPSSSSSQTASNIVYGHFKVYYYETGPHTVDPTDNNTNSVPDYVESTLLYFENAYQKYVDTLGFVKPPLDTDGYYHAVLVDFATLNYPSKIIGATFRRDSLGMDNPNTPFVTEPNASRSFILLRNSYVGVDANYSENELLRINAAHEFFHAVQNGYNSRLSGFFLESTATFITDEVLKKDYGLKTFMKKFYAAPDLALDYDKQDDSLTQHNYASWIFWKFMHEHAGTNVIQNVLDKMVYATTKNDELNALQIVLANVGKSLASVFSDFCVANYVFSSNNAAYPNYSYTDASVYIGAGILGSKQESAFLYNGTPLSYKSINGNKRLMRLSSDNFYVSGTSRKFSIKVTPTNASSDLEVLVVRTRSSDQISEVSRISHRTLNGVKEFWTNIDNPDDYQSYGIIVKRFDRYVSDTSSLQYDLEIGAPDPWTVFDIAPYSKAGYNSAGDIDLDPSNGTLWVTTGAVLKYDGRWHTIRDPFPFGGSWKGWAKMNGKDWFGYQSAGFTKYDGAYTDYTFNTDTNITPFVSEVVSSGSVIWKAGDKVVRYDGSGFKKFGSADGLPTDNISDIALSPADGSVWVGSDAGVGKYSGGAWSWFNAASGLPDNTIWSLDVGKSGVVWVGFYAGKIARFNGTTFTEVTNPDVPSGCTIPCIVDDIKLTPSENVWVGMRSAGASFFNGTVWKNFNPVNTGIPEMVGVHKIAVQGDTCVWFAMDTKIARYVYATSASGIKNTAVNKNYFHRIVPNPATTSFRIDSTETISLVEIYDTKGVVVSRFDSDFQNIDIRNCSPGIYIVKIKDTGGLSSQKLVVK